MKKLSIFILLKASRCKKIKIDSNNLHLVSFNCFVFAAKRLFNIFSLVSPSLPLTLVQIVAVVMKSKVAFGLRSAGPRIRNKWIINIYDPWHLLE